MSNDKVILITGCSSPSGIGFATARVLAKSGHRVFATVRDPSKAAKIQEGFKDDRLRVRILDVTIQESIDAVIQEITEAEARIDVLINNAGYGLLGAVEDVDLDRARAHFDTNVFGAVRMIQAVLPTMRRLRTGHIINVNSVFTSHHCIPGFGYYIGSKTALDKMCEALAVEVAPWDIRVTNFQPGPVRTDLSREYGNRLKHLGNPYVHVVEDAYQWVFQKSTAIETAEQVATDLKDLIQQVSPSLYHQSGEPAQAFVRERRPDPTGATHLRDFIEFFAFLERQREREGAGGNQPEVFRADET